ncbi:trypsin-like serine peptidase [Photobacterium leiognathi]|uniref:Peptidase S1 domain-containing protein n=1 Tax=Photobacterium leiognathi TaxID=553611 RepID=A0A2T3M5D5_PHOLE|nr:trypsin-like serine protease [Photobacterium leiognathi]PSV87115.1 hypothetical protein CTM89_18765 [Photobacterium leiognathi]
MEVKKKFIVSSICLLPLWSNAVVINENVFTDNGGDLNNVPESIKVHNNDLREQSFNNEFLTVGEIYGCTATWLGNDDLGWTYILTAAHCVPYKGETTPIKRKFSSWDGRIIANGEGFIYVPKERINRPKGFGGASTDIAILKLPTHDILTDHEGSLVSKPIINDKFDELNRKVMFVGYGQWGVGLDISGGYKPEEGKRRLYGESEISSIFEMKHGIGAKYKPKGKTKYWARLAPGDSGSAWWQDNKGHRVIIATTNGGSTKLSTGARVAQYASWIKEIYNDVNLLSRTFLSIDSDNKEGEVGDYYEFYNNDKCSEYYELISLDNNYDENIPMTSEDNANWQFRGPFFEHNKEDLVMGDIFLYDNPISNEMELFKLIAPKNNDTTDNIPSNKHDNNSWIYMGTSDISFTQLESCPAYTNSLPQPPITEHIDLEEEINEKVDVVLEQEKSSDSLVNKILISIENIFLIIMRFFMFFR